MKFNSLEAIFSFLKKHPQLLVLVAAVAFFGLPYFYYQPKTSEMVPIFEKFVDSIAYERSVVIQKTKGDGFSGGVTVRYLVPVGTTNKDIYEHYCKEMRQNGWVDSQEVQIGGVDEFRSSCADPLMNEGSYPGGSEVFDFGFCKRNGEELHVAWVRDKNLDHPVDYKYSVIMTWRYTGPASIGCLKWMDKWEAEETLDRKVNVLNRLI